MIKCACLLQFNHNFDKILLVKVRNNQKWYLPGGKIESSEIPQECLIREIDEELNIKLSSSNMEFQFSIIGEAYGVDDDVELNCFTTSFINSDTIIEPNSEISEVRYVDWINEKHILAPAVISLCNSEYFKKLQTER